MYSLVVVVVVDRQGGDMVKTITKAGEYRDTGILGIPIPVFLGILIPEIRKYRF